MTPSPQSASALLPFSWNRLFLLENQRFEDDNLIAGMAQVDMQEKFAEACGIIPTKDLSNLNVPKTDDNIPLQAGLRVGRLMGKAQTVSETFALGAVNTHKGTHVVHALIPDRSRTRLQTFS